MSNKSIFHRQRSDQKGWFNFKNQWTVKGVVKEVGGIDMR